MRPDSHHELDDAEGPLLVELADFEQLVGQRLGTSPWRKITQEMVDGFAEATGDDQWIHVDEERAAAGPFGHTIVHGYMVLALVPLLLDQIVVVPDARLTINYGLDRLRYPAPVPVGSRVRMHAECAAAYGVEGGIHTRLSLNFEREGTEKPVCVAEILFRYYR